MSENKRRDAARDHENQPENPTPQQSWRETQSPVTGRSTDRTGTAQANDEPGSAPESGDKDP